MQVDLEDLGFDGGGALLVKRALRMVPEGESVTIVGTNSDLHVHLAAWCRAEGHECQLSDARG
jgi:TusA-related sulfurtransferase